MPGLMRRVARLPIRKTLLLLEAGFWLCLARVALRLLPFPRLAGYIGHLHRPAQATRTMHAQDQAIAMRVSHAVNATAINSPIRMVCLPRALAAWQMLHLRGVHARLHFGKLVGAPGRPEHETHAWLSSAQVEVTGYPVAHGCVEIGYFARPESGNASSDVP